MNAFSKERILAAEREIASKGADQGILGKILKDVAAREAKKPKSERKKMEDERAAARKRLRAKRTAKDEAEGPGTEKFTENVGDRPKEIKDPIKLTAAELRNLNTYVYAARAMHTMTADNKTWIANLILPKIKAEAERLGYIQHYKEFKPTEGTIGQGLNTLTMSQSMSMATAISLMNIIG